MDIQTSSLAIAALLAFAPPSQGLCAEQLPYRAVAPARLGRALTPGTIILDVRMASEILGKDGRPWGLKCATCRTRHVPYDLDFGFLESPLPRPRLLQGRSILVVCAIGVRSDLAARSLVRLGYAPMMLEGGLRELPASWTDGEKPPAPAPID